MSTYARPDDLVEMTAHGIRLAHPETSFPEPLEPHHVAHLGYLPAEADPEPALQPGEELLRGPLRLEGGRILRSWVVQPSPQVDWADAIAARRYQVECAGITVDGMRVDTDDRSKLLINGAALESMLDPQYVMQWKTLAGFIELNATQVLGVARAVRAHVQACFDREAALLDALADESFTPAMLAEGWPTN